MNLIKTLAAITKKLRPEAKKTAVLEKTAASGRGILLFAETGQVIRAEAALKAEGFAIQVKAPPPSLRSGCDLVIEFSIVQEPAIAAALKKSGLSPLQSVPVSGELLEPVSVFQHKDYGDYLMVRAANMKITIEKSSGLIVNVSGGGCPDVPYLAHLLIGKNLSKARPPLENGNTLCGYALQLAFDEAKNTLAKGYT